LVLVLLSAAFLKGKAAHREGKPLLDWSRVSCRFSPPLLVLVALVVLVVLVELALLCCATSDLFWRPGRIRGGTRKRRKSRLQ